MNEEQARELVSKLNEEEKKKLLHLLEEIEAQRSADEETAG